MWCVGDQVRESWDRLTQFLLESTTLSMLRKSGKDESQAKICSQRIINLFRPWSEFSSDSFEKLEQKLTRVLLQVIALSRQLRHQTARWTIKHSGISHAHYSPKEPLPFSPTAMSDRDNTLNLDEDDSGYAGGATVHFLIWPGLYKGNDRKGYKQECVVPECVICGEPQADERLVVGV
jgi:hypothetical protein